MLELGAEEVLSKDDWMQVAARADLPCCPDEYFNESGPLAVSDDSRRRYHRFHMRSVAVVRRGDEELAVYARDVSRLGIGFYSPLQLFPGESVLIYLPGKQPIALEITRCRRRKALCFECGSVFSRANY